jgi:hypothetical protein
MLASSSHPWKQLLLRQAATIGRLRQPHRWTEASSVKLEAAVALGFYALRHLVNAFLLSPGLVHRPIPMTAFPSRRVDRVLLEDAGAEVLYDLSAGKAVSHDLLFLCHQVTANCLFAPAFGPQKVLQGIRVTSDHQRSLALYGVGIDTIQGLLEAVASER